MASPANLSAAQMLWAEPVYPWVVSHIVDDPPAAIALIIVTVLLLVRLKIELDIRHDEDEPAFERKLHRSEQINSLVIVPAVFGLIAIVRRLDVG